MYEDFDEKIKSEVIILQDIKNFDKHSCNKYYLIESMEWEKREKYGGVNQKKK